jgi:hypothetical protein
VKALFLLGLVVAVIFWKAFLPGQLLFSNDGPLGALSAECHRMPGRFFGGWSDLNVLGANEGAATPTLTFLLLWLLGPVWFLSLSGPLSLLLLGFAAWCCFRRLGLAPAACLLGALAAMLNSAFFSVTCWGVKAHTISAAMGFLALAAVAADTPRDRWLRHALAGFALGMGVCEAGDVGAIFSVVVAGFMFCQALGSEGRVWHRVLTGAGRVALAAACAAFLAWQSMASLVSTQIEGKAGMQQDAQTREQRWDWATQWSLPKREALGLVVPGLFGYRLDTPHGGAYWGRIGRAAEVEKFINDGREGPQPAGYVRFSGSGYYAGVTVVLLAFWAVLTGFRRTDPGHPARRLWIGFWLAAGAAGLLLGFGRYALFYHALYELPYFSTVRNPIKFLYVLSFALAILAAWGADQLWRRHVHSQAGGERAPRATSARQAGTLERGVLLAGAVLWLGCLAVWIAFGAFQGRLENYLQEQLFDPAAAQEIARFSIRQLGWFVALLGANLIGLGLLFGGVFAGRRSLLGAGLMGLLLAGDLTWANRPWILWVNYPEKYASNPIVDELRQRPWERRVAILPLEADPRLKLLSQLYQIEWTQHLFPYYGIQALDSVQERSVPADLKAFRDVLGITHPKDAPALLARYWQLTSTRYLLGPADSLPTLITQMDPQLRRFHIAARFDVSPRPGVRHPHTMEDFTAVPSPQGQYALIEYSAALSRASLYANWTPNIPDKAALEQLGSPAFDPTKTVLVSDMIEPATNAPAMAVGQVDFVSYASREVSMRTQAEAPTVLLLNDRFDANWRVWVDGKPEKLLRCNYLMRGVSVPAGNHVVQFRFQPQVKLLYNSIAALAIALALMVWAAFGTGSSFREAAPG